MGSGVCARGNPLEGGGRFHSAANGSTGEPVAAPISRAAAPLKPAPHSFGCLEATKRNHGFKAKTVKGLRSAGSARAAVPQVSGGYRDMRRHAAACGSHIRLLLGLFSPRTARGGLSAFRSCIRPRPAVLAALSSVSPLHSPLLVVCFSSGACRLLHTQVFCVPLPPLPPR